MKGEIVFSEVTRSVVLRSIQGHHPVHCIFSQSIFFIIFLLTANFNHVIFHQNDVTLSTQNAALDHDSHLFCLQAGVSGTPCFTRGVRLEMERPRRTSTFSEEISISSTTLALKG